MRTSTAPERVLPRWPFTVMFAWFPAWWLLGLGEMAWIPLSFVMVFYLVRRGRIEVPRGFGIWLLFMVWMVCSGIGIDTGGRMIGFVYRALLYLVTTIVFVYVYNARSRLTTRYVGGVLTIFWFITVVGGYVGVLFPLLSFHTPLSMVLPHALLDNELVHEMAVRQVTQYNPDSWLQIDPRPSAPFLYTNGWGNVYSMLTPIVIGYMVAVRRQKRFWVLLVALPISLVPALLTLNRGMLIGLALALAYVTVRFVLRGNLRAILALLGLALVVGVVFMTVPVAQRITDRLAVSSTTEDRANLYDETWQRTLESPVFGYGAPRPSLKEGAPSVGTQGQMWMVLFSHGIPGLVFFMGWLIWAYLRTLHRWDPLGLASNTALLVVVVESTYYGILTAGLTIAMIAAALAIPQAEPPLEAEGSRPILKPTKQDTAVPTH